MRNDEKIAIDEQEEQVRLLQANYVSLRSQLEEKLFELTEMKHMTEVKRCKWLGLYGDLHLLREQQRHRKVRAMRSFDILQNNPMITTPDALQEALLVTRQHLDSALRYLSMEIKRSQHLVPIPNDLHIPSSYHENESEIAEIQARIKDIVRRAWMAFHPDKLEHMGLPREILEEIDLIRHQLPSPRGVDLSFSPHQVGHRLPSLCTLLANFQKGKAILTAVGVLIDDHEPTIDRMVTSIEEKIVWLSSEISFLKKLIACIFYEMEGVSCIY